MDSIRVELGERSYDVQVGEGIRSGLGEGVDPERTSRLALIVDGGLPTAHTTSIRDTLVTTRLPLMEVVVPPGEASKTMAQVERICEVLAQAGCDRHSLLVAAGGGVVTDLGGFCAGILFRGVDWISVPTTLLAQVDAGTGGKTGVNLAAGKNLAGLFWQPQAVYCDVEFLSTLPPRDLRAGLAEVVKCALIADVRYFERLELDGAVGLSSSALAEAVSRSVRVKAALVSRDEREISGERRLLNFGHTVGHALEAGSDYSLLHGEAVALGMIAALRVSQRMGIGDATLESRLLRLLQQLGLPAELDAALGRFPIDGLLRDKKRQGGDIHFVCLEEVGRPKVLKLRVEAILEMLRR